MTVLIAELLGKWAPDGGRLELFARNLLPGWTSWGNEARVCVCERLRSFFRHKFFTP